MNNAAAASAAGLSPRRLPVLVFFVIFRQHNGFADDDVITRHTATGSDETVVVKLVVESVSHANYGATHRFLEGLLLFVGALVFGILCDGINVCVCE